MSTATSPTGIDADKGNCGRPSGERLVTLTFDRGAILDEKKYHTVNPPSGAMVMADEEATHPTGITVEIVGIEKGDRGRSCEEHNV